jgi:hypothetical protein
VRVKVEADQTNTQKIGILDVIVCDDLPEAIGERIVFKVEV